MPPVVIAAGIAAGGSILGAAVSSSSASKAAKTQQNVANQQIAANNANRAQITGMEQPTIDRGNAAGGIYGGLLGIGDAAASKSALDTWRGSVGYQDVLKTGLGAVNSNAYARGLGDSGATLKALQTRGSAIADQNQGVYMSNLNNLIQSGNSAIGNIAGVNTATTNANNGAMQNAADASSNATLTSGAAWNNALKNLTNIGLNTASSFGGAPNFNGAIKPPVTTPGFGDGDPSNWGRNTFGGWN